MEKESIGSQQNDLLGLVIYEAEHARMYAPWDISQRIQRMKTYIQELERLEHLKS